MNRNRRGFSRGRHRLCLAAVVACCALLLALGPALTAMAGQAQEQGQEEKKENKDKPKKYTNDDLKPPSRPPDRGGDSGASGDDGVPQESADDAEAGDEAAEPVDPWASVGVATDSEGRGEAYWRQAMTEARGAADAARRNRDLLQSEMNRRQADFTAIDDPAARDVVNERIQELRGLLSEADAAIAEAEQALRDLQEDARQSGALPGWLR